MNLQDIAVVTECMLDCRRTSKTSFIANFHGLEIMDDGFLKGGSGFGETMSDAKRDLCESLAGQRVVTKAHSSLRKEIQLPQKITWR